MAGWVQRRAGQDRRGRRSSRLSPGDLGGGLLSRGCGGLLSRGYGVSLSQLYVMIFVEHGRRRVHAAEITAHLGAGVGGSGPKSVDGVR